MKSILDSDIRAGDTIHFTVLEPLCYPEWLLLAMQGGGKNTIQITRDQLLDIFPHARREARRKRA